MKIPTETTLLQYLADKGVSTRRTHGTEVVAHCVFCGETKKQPKLYLNTDSWLWDCKLCGESGNRVTLLRHFGDEDEQAVHPLPGVDANARRRVLKAAAHHAHELLLENDDVLEELLGRGLSPETIVKNQLGYVPKNYGFSRSLGDFQIRDLVASGLMNADGLEFLSDSVVIPYLHHQQVVQLRAKDRSGDRRYRTAGGDNVRLYNEDALQGAERVLVTEGEFDALITQQVLAHARDPLARSIGVVALAGAAALPENFGSYFTGMKRVYVGFDPDPAGDQGTLRVEQQVGAISRPVELPRGEPKCDWTEYLRDETPNHPWGGNDWRGVMQLLAAADLVGKRVFTISEVYRQWEHDQLVHPGIKFGYPTLDSRIKPGLRPGQICVPLAKTGTGKTAFLVNVAHNTRSHRVLFISLELTSVELFGMLRRIHFFHNPRVPQAQMLNDYENLRIFDENRLGRADLATVVAEYTEEVGAPPELVMIDYLGYYARSFGSDAYLRTSDAVMQLKADAKQQNLAILTPAQVNRGAKQGTALEADDARDSGVIEETADFVFSLFRPDQAIGEEGVSGAFNLGIVKSRRGGVGAVSPLLFSNMSLAIVERNDRRNAVRVEMENEQYIKGADYETWRRDQSHNQLQLVR